MAADVLEARPIEVRLGSRTLVGEEAGEGPTVVLAHGLTATRRYVVHGSLALPRGGFRVVSYDARGHGDSHPAPDDEGYAYECLAHDLGAIVEQHGGEAPVALVGHSMGAHTIARYALENSARVAAAVFVAPAVIGLPPPDEALARWDVLADSLASGGVAAFLDANEAQLAPEWRDRIRVFTRARMERHRDLEAVARALREVPRSVPFDGMAELEHLDVPALVVASHDVADPSHPYAVAEAWATALPDASLVSEAEGDPPLAWRGGKLSRAIAGFLERADVERRHRA